MQCTDCAARWFAEAHGDYGLHFDRGPNGTEVRDADTWIVRAKAAGYEVGTEPRVGSVAVYRGGEFAKYGHVAYVTGIHGTHVSVKECNFPIPLEEHIGSYPAERASGYIYPKVKIEAPNAAPAPEPKKETSRSIRLEQYKDPRDGRMKPAVTTYNPEVGQNDSSPWIGAAGVRMQEGMIALSGDLLQRTAWDKKAGVRSHFTGSIPFGTTVKLVGDPGEDPRCTGTFVVQDTLNARYARPPYKGHRADIFRVHRKDNFSCKNVTLTW